MIEAKKHFDHVEQCRHANLVCALVAGFRTDKPNVHQIFDDLTRDYDTFTEAPLDRFAPLIALSEARIAKQKQKQP